LKLYTLKNRKSRRHGQISEHRQPTKIEVVKNLNKPITTKKSPEQDGFTAEFYQTFEELIPQLSNYIINLKWREPFQTHSLRTSLTCN
jgi:hypothetical protein